MAKSKPGKMFAILSRCQRTGRWRLASRFSVLALLGTCRLDLHGALVDGDRSRVKITVVLGSATVILPRGAEVRPSGLSVLSISSVDVPENDGESQLPPIEIEWTSILGRMRIGVEPEPEPKAAASTVLTSESAAEESPPVGLGFEDLEPETTEPETTDTTDTPTTGVGFEDLEPETTDTTDTSDTPTTGVGFEDLEPETTEPETTDTTDTSDTSTTGVGFEDLEPETTEAENNDTEATVPEPAQG